jgi:hypothetical protein
LRGFSPPPLTFFWLWDAAHSADVNQVADIGRCRFGAPSRPTRSGYGAFITNLDDRAMNELTSTLNAPETAQLLIDLETRQDQVLRELDELNSRIEQAIAYGQLGVRSPASLN